MSTDITTIHEIDIDLIDPHPKNPRKDLGDLTEIAASIKANGIFQNLTIVPRPDVEGRYYAVIGHRRRAASKLAGLQFLPCVISDMDEKQQVETMMMENMQRNDLTLIEQAEGFQMMMDLGNTVEDITTKTGFSESTVRRRMNLLKLDKKKIQEAAGRGATLMDFAKLEKIKDIKKRNKLLEQIGTNNFEWELSSALRDQSWKEKKSIVIKELEQFAKKTDKNWPNGYERIKRYDGNDTEVTIPKDSKKKEYVYYVDSSGIALFRKYPKQGKSSADKKREAEEKERKERRAKLEELCKKAFEQRAVFVEGCAGLKKHVGEILKFSTRATIDSGWYSNSERLAEMLGIENERYAFVFADMEEKYNEDPEKIALLTAWCALDGENESWTDYYGAYKQNDKLDAIYDMFAKLGYSISDEEKALRDGTHELYLKPEEPEKEKAPACGECPIHHWYSSEADHTRVENEDGTVTNRPCEPDTHYCCYNDDGAAGRLVIALDDDYDPDTAPEWCPRRSADKN